MVFLCLKTEIHFCEINYSLIIARHTWHRSDVVSSTVLTEISMINSPHQGWTKKAIEKTGKPDGVIVHQTPAVQDGIYVLVKKPLCVPPPSLKSFLFVGCCCYMKTPVIIYLLWNRRALKQAHASAQRCCKYPKTLAYMELLRVRELKIETHRHTSCSYTKTLAYR